MDGRQRDRRGVVLFCADLCLPVGFEDAHHSSDASPLSRCSSATQECPWTAGFLSGLYASGFEQVPRGVIEEGNSLQLQGHTSHFLWPQTSSYREKAAEYEVK